MCLVRLTSVIELQILPFESIVQHQIESDADLRVTHFKRLAFHIYEQLRRTVSYTTRAKSLTGFGPAASEEKTPAKIVDISCLSLFGVQVFDL